MYVARLTYPKLRQKVVEHALRHGADTVLIEDAGSGQTLLQDLKTEPVRPIGIVPDGDKQMRLIRASRKIEAGFVYLPNDTSWLQEFQREVLAFPRARHDDQVDSLSQFLNWNGLSRRRDQARLLEALDDSVRFMQEQDRQLAINRPDSPFYELQWGPKEWDY